MERPGCTQLSGADFVYGGRLHKAPNKQKQNTGGGIVLPHPTSLDFTVETDLPSVIMAFPFGLYLWIEMHYYHCRPLEY